VSKDKTERKKEKRKEKKKRKKRRKKRRKKKKKRKRKEKGLTWGHIGDTSAVGVQELSLIELPREPKVNQLEVVVSVEEQVLWLQVPVNKPLLVAVLHRAHQL